MSSLYFRFINRLSTKSILLSCPPKPFNKIRCFGAVFCTSHEQNNDIDKNGETKRNNKDHVTFSTIRKFITNQFEPELTKQQVMLFLKCCGKISINEKPETRMAMLSALWDLLKAKKYQFDIDHYNLYVKVSTENRICIDCDNFLAQMQSEPSHDTYKLLLENVGERGDLDQCSFLLNLMNEKGYTVDEESFGFLVLGHTIQLGLEGGENISKMKVPINDTAKFALIRGTIIKGDITQFRAALQKYPVLIDEQKFLLALEDLCLNDKHLWLPELLNIATLESYSRNFAVGVQMLCIKLIQQGKFDLAFYIYKKFVRNYSESGYAKELIREVIRARAPVDTIMDTVLELKETGLNPLALENAAEFALKTEYLDLAWNVFAKFSYLRPHFFWPILLSAGRKDGELGILTTLQDMFSLGIKADMETLEHYCLPFCNLSEPTLLVTKLQDIGYTVKEILTPVLIVLVSQQDLQRAQDLCDAYNVSIFAERLISPLVGSWKNSDNVESIVRILQKSCETVPSNIQWLEMFLRKIFHVAKSSQDLEKLISTLKDLKKNKLYINPSTAENLLKMATKKFLEEDRFSDVRVAIDILQDVCLTEEPTVLPHPSNMNTNELECHLVELENKRMNTRGVLRKLIQLHNNAGNLDKVAELRNKFIAHGYSESLGMKSSVMHSYIQSRDLPSALDLYQEIKVLQPHFKMDSFKIVDLATLLVENNKVEEAIKLLKEESKKGSVVGGHSIQRNCVNLLKTASDPNHLNMLFHTLVDNGYCKANNVVLGSLVSIHMKRNDIEKAVETFVDCAHKYKATPLQLELLCKILREQRLELFEKVVDAIQLVHGKSGAALGVISALAEEKMQESLKKFLTRSSLFILKATMHKRYDRWVHEKKIVPLKTMAAALQKLPIENMDLPYVYLSIMRVYSLENDCEGALMFWEELISEEVVVSEEIKSVLYNLLKENKCDVPKTLKVQA